MNCRNIEPLLLAEPDGVLTSEQRAVLEQHVATCPACRQTRAHLAEALESFRADAARIAVPDLENEWSALRVQIDRPKTSPEKKRRMAPLIWFSAPLAAAAALVFAYVSLSPKVQEPAAPTAVVAQAEFVEAGNADVSTMVYVDKESGWLVVWAADDGVDGKSGS